MMGSLTSKGQITVPRAVRQKLNLKRGDRVEFVLMEDGTVRLVARTTTLEDLATLLPKPTVSLSVEEMDEVVARQVIARDRD